MLQSIFSPADMLLPNWEKNVCPETWSVIACDQFTSSPEYWEQVRTLTQNAPSSLNLILPEIYLHQPDMERKIQEIHQTMQKYWEDDLFQVYPEALVYTERVQSNGVLRNGVVGKIDLEAYDYHTGSTSPVRATEATVLERIPPRMKVRENALLESPHIMILINDEKKSVIEPCETQKTEMRKLYDTELMLGGGHLTGYLMSEEQQKAFLSRLDVLLASAGNLKFAMGDGNHSLATAKACYEKLKQEHPEQDFSDHPARYALVELVNLHSPALEFEAIHRIITETSPETLMQYLTETLELSENAADAEQAFIVMQKNQEKKYYIHKPSASLTVGSLQNALDAYLQHHDGKIDYIHGTQTLAQLAEKSGNIGFVLPDMDKKTLFSGVEKDGVLPRKTFSTGHAEDKRYYMECRKIR